MNKKPEIVLYISVLPIVILLGLILGAGYFLMGEDIRLPSFNNNKAKFRRLEGFPTSIGVDKEYDKKRVVIKNEQELNEFLNYVDEAGLVTVKEKINFDKEYLVGASTKTLGEDGHAFKVRRLYKDSDNKKLLVSLLRTDPGETCAEDEYPNIWIELIAIDKTDWEIDFERLTQIEECD